MTAATPKPLRGPLPEKAAARVLIVDDHQIIREGLAALLQNCSRYRLVGEASNGQMAIQLVSQLHPDVVLMDISMPQLNGMDATREIRLRAPQTRIIALSMHIEGTVVRQMLQAGASGFLSKNCAASDLLNALDRVLANQVYLSSDIALQEVQRLCSPLVSAGGATPEELSTKDRRLLQLLAEGKNTKEVALCLNLSPKTIDVYRRRLMTRLQLASIAELTKFAIRQGLTSLEC